MEAGRLAELTDDFSPLIELFKDAKDIIKLVSVDIDDYTKTYKLKLTDDSFIIIEQCERFNDYYIRFASYEVGYHRKDVQRQILDILQDELSKANFNNILTNTKG